MRPMTSENGRKKTRRPNGTGSEWKDAKGVWHTRKQADPDPRTGRRRWIEAQEPTKTAAIRAGAPPRWPGPRMAAGISPSFRSSSLVGMSMPGMYASAGTHT